MLESHLLVAVSRMKLVMGHLMYHMGDGNCATVPSTSALLPAHMSEM